MRAALGRHFSGWALACVLALCAPAALAQAAADRFAIMINVAYLPPEQEEKLVQFDFKEVRLKALEKGLILLTCGVHGNVIRFLAPITIQDEVFAEALDILEAAMVEARAA